MTIQNIATASTLNFNLNGVKTATYGLQGAPFTATPYLMDFRNLTVDSLRFTPRGAYIDNTKSANAVTLTVQPIDMQITVPAGALWAVHWPTPRQMWMLISSNSTSTDVTNIYFVDYPIMPYKSDETFTLSDPIAVTQSGAWNVGVTGGSVGLLAGNAIIGQVNQAAGSNPWNVSVSNFPATQPVSGSVTVSNFPATQVISGSVNVSNFPSTQSISGTVDILQTPFHLTGSQALTTAGITFGTQGFSTLRLLKIDLWGYTASSGVQIVLRDGAGNALYTVVLPVVSSATTSINYFFSDLMNVFMNNSAAGATGMILSNPTAGSIYMQLGYS